MKIKFMESIDDIHILHFAEANDVAFVPNDPDTGSSEIVMCYGDRSFIIPLCDEAFSHLMELSDGIHMDQSGYLAIDAKNYYSNPSIRVRFNTIKRYNYDIWDSFKEGVSKDAK